MKIIRNICGLLLIAFLILFGVVCLGAALFRDSVFMDTALGMVSQTVFMARLGVAVLTVTIIYLFTAFPGRTKGKYLKFVTQGGSVQVNLAAAANYLSKLKKEFAAVVSLNPKLGMKGRGVDVTLRTGIKSGTRIPELSDMLQKRARQCLAEDLGLEDIHDIRIMIQEISGPPPTHEVEDRPVVDLSEDTETPSQEKDNEE